MPPKRKASSIAAECSPEDDTCNVHDRDDTKRGKSASTTTSSSVIGKVLHFLVCKEGGSDKFYEITLVNNSVISRYGRTGSNGASVVKDFPTVDQAHVFITSIVNEKLKKGYKSKNIPVDNSATTELSSSSCRFIAPKLEPDLVVAPKKEQVDDSEMHYLECTTGGSNKFYELKVMKSELTVQIRYGRIGSSGATSRKLFKNVGEMQMFVSSTLKEKLSKGYEGYVEVVSTQLDDDADAVVEEEPVTAMEMPSIKKEAAPNRVTPPQQQPDGQAEDTEIHYLECKTGDSSKFYELKVMKSDLSVQTRFGTIGSNGAMSRKFFKNMEEMQSFVAATLRDKLCKGYDGYSEVGQFDNDEAVVGLEEQQVANIQVSAANKSSSSSSSAAVDDGSIVHYLECKEGNSNKYYEIVVKGNDATIRYGRIGAPGNPTTKTFASHNEAVTFGIKTANEKKKKGYKETKNEIVTTFVPTVDTGGPIDIDALENPAQALEDGRIILIQGSGKTPYKVKKFVGGYSCSCPGWIFQVKPKGAQRASCKHLRQIRGDDAEEERCGNATVSAAAASGSKDASITSKITLAQQWKSGQNPKGYLMSEKLDGMRAYWTQGKLWTRNGNEIIAPNWFIAGLPEEEDLDGELFLGRQRFEDCMSIARRTDASNDWKQLKYVVFDCPTAPGGIVDRLKRAETLLENCENEYAILHPHTVCESEEELLLKLTEIEKVGGEGLMLRHPTAKHRGGRNTDLLKVKTFLDDEALVLDHESGKGKYEGMVGSLICINKAGTRFKVGSGLSEDIRSYRTAPQVGSVITFKYFELTRDGVPRFPTFMRIRPDVDASVFPK